MEQLVEHKYLLPQAEIHRDEENWLVTHGIPMVEAFQLAYGKQPDMPDLRVQRFLLAHELANACHKPFFYDEYGHMEPSPSEQDRLGMIEHLQFISSFTGLLNVEEINLITKSPWHVFLHFKPPEDDDPLPSRKELQARIKKWKEAGCKIFGFQGSYDPPTEVHLANATDAHIIALENGVKAKIIFIIDGDELIQRKTTKHEPRPRYSIKRRRAVLEPFWVVAGTCISKVETNADIDGYIEEYIDLDLDGVVFTVDPESDQEDRKLLFSRKKAVRAAGLQIVWAGYIPGGITSTELMRGFSSRLD